MQRLKGKYFTPTDNLENDPVANLNNTLFFKGLKDADCFYWLYKNNLI